MSNSDCCSNCGECLDGLPALLSGEKAPCPHCGSTARNIHVTINETIKATDYVATLASREGRSIGFRESVREGRAASADRHDNGSLSYSILGSSPQGEEDTLSACRILVKVLNASGGNWADPVPGEGIVDCEAVDARFSDQKVSIQVIRAIADQELWKNLNLQGNIQELNVSKNQLICLIKDAIEKKASERSIPQSIRPSLTLALDATRLPVLGFEDVVERFQSQFGGWTKSLGFEAVWLVGPQDSLTWRLDIADPNVE